MSYKLKFLPSAWKEWEKLGAGIKEQFKKKLGERLQNPLVQADRLRGFKNHYKIKLRSVGYRMVYEVEKKEVVVFVIAVGKRENDLLYRRARRRDLKNKDS